MAALLIAGIAAREGIELWPGDSCGCTSLPGFEAANADGCAGGGCE